MIEFIKRSLAGGIVLSGLVVSLLLTGAGTALAADLDTVPAAVPGSIVEVSGSADTLLLPEQVRLCWNAPGCSDLGTVSLSLLQTSYSADVTIPSTADSGVHEIYACTSLSCGSASIDVVVEPTPSTTTTLPTTTTIPATTTTQPTPTTTPPTVTTTVGGPSSTIPGSPGTTAEGGSDGVAAVEVSAEADDPETEIEENGQRTKGSVYTPPTTDYSPPSTAADTREPSTNGDEEVVVVNAAAGDLGGLGWSFDSPVVFWAAWLLVVVVASCLVSGIWWLAGRRRAE